MKKCEVCHTRFSWKQVYESFLLAYRPIFCKKCGTKHQITIGGRLTFVGLAMIPFIIFMSFLPPDAGLLPIIGIGGPLIAAGSFLAPFLVTYRKS